MAETDSESVARKMQEEAYFSEARAWYSVLYHFPIAERSFYAVVIVLGLLVVCICVDAFFAVFPLAPRVPFAIVTDDIMEDVPTLIRLRSSSDEDPNGAVLQYFLKSYVQHREAYAYDPALLTRNFYNIRSQSTPEVFTAYRDWYDASNPSSPYNLYGSQTVRSIHVDQVSASGGRAKVVFTEGLTGPSLNKTTRWVADVAYGYEPFTVEQDIQELSMTNFFGIALDVYFHPDKYNKKESFRITPMTFVVSNYNANPYISE